MKLIEIAIVVVGCFHPVDCFILMISLHLRCTDDDDALSMMC